ncbi:MAG: leucine--tRNA ligase [Patescibacteria group bacterium]
MEQYNPQRIEAKWQKFWEKKGFYKTEDSSKKPKKYILVEFPYPSGDGLHVGHVRSYSALDAVCRKKRMEGFNVLFPIGWDAFGLPTENYAIKNGIHPSAATGKNIANFKRQLKSLGLSFDWSREINTTDPEYYKWTQWIFLKLFEKDMAYQAEIPVNWCPSCKIGLANEEVVDGACERCHTPVGEKTLKQWMIRITKYADRLIDDLKNVDFPERVKSQEINWIGKSEGAEIKFKIVIGDTYDNLPVFTTRPDTLFGCTYLVLSPEHSLIENLKLKIENWDEVQKYRKEAKKKSELERTELTKDKTGVELKGIKAINPANNEEIPVFVADYVLSSYGTGAIMAVPAHDQRDFDFAKKYNLPIKIVVDDKERLVDSGKFNGMESDVAKWEITKFVGGKKTINYKLRDWVFSRQHYWGEPIPIIHCLKCGQVPVPEKDLPVELPYVEKYQPTGTGESPLAVITDWVNVKCPKCGGQAKRETDTMPNWAGSNWYYLRYLDPKNNKALADVKKIKYWMPLDWYNGGMEHTTLHLLYSRFVYKFLYDIGIVPSSEPYQKRTSHGMVLAEDNRKMSKSFGNVINPDDIVKKFGADSLRLYEMFMGPFDQAIAWSTNGLRGCYRFLNKVWQLQFKVKRDLVSHLETKSLSRLLHQTIKKVTEDIESLNYNTAISALMILVNQSDQITKNSFEILLKLLAPFAPHIAEELWSNLGNKNSIFEESWPKYDEKLMQEDKINLIIQINGKFRDKIEVEAEISEGEVKKLTLNREKVKQWVAGKEIKKIIFIKNKLINIVCAE